MENKCPYCGNDNFIPDIVYRNTECYGSNRHHFRCEHCDNVVTGYFIRTVRIENIAKSHKSKGDWG